VKTTLKNANYFFKETKKNSWDMLANLNFVGLSTLRVYVKGDQLSLKRI